MNYEIDQSGKVEDSNKLTVVAFANGKVKSLVISAKEKQRLIKFMRVADAPRKIFIYKIFSALIFLLLQKEKASMITIDREYPGHEGTIKDVILHLFRKSGQKAPNIVFDQIGKKSKAHIKAIEVFRKQSKADVIISFKDVLSILY